VVQGKHDLGELLYELNYPSFAVFLVLSALFRRVMDARRVAHETLQTAMRKAMRDEVAAYQKSHGEAPWMPRDK